MAELTIPLGIDTAQAMQTLRSLGQLADQQFDKKRKVQIDDAAIKQFGDNLADAMQRANRALNFDDAFDQANSKVGELEASLQGAVLAFGKNSPIAQGLVQDLIKAKQEAKQFNDAIAFVDNIKADITFGDSLSEARKEADRLQQELAAIIATQGESGAAYDEAVAKLREATQQADKLESALKAASSSVQIKPEITFGDTLTKAKAQAATLQGELAQIIRTQGKSGAAYEEAVAKLKAAREEAEGLEQALKDAGEAAVDIELPTPQATGGFAGLFGNIGESMAGLFNPATLAAGGVAALTTGLVQAFNVGTELNAAFLDMQAKTGVAGKEFELLKDAAQDAFVGGVGESVAEATKVIAEAEFRLGDVFNPKEIGDFTKQSQALANLYDKDVNEVLRLSSPFVKQFGLDGTEAANLLSLAFKEAGSAQDDVLDSLSEYSQLAQEAGFSAQSFTEILTRGTKEGLFNTDKIADALKETQIRLKAGDYKTAFDDLGKSSSGAEKAVTADIRKILDAAQNGQISVADGLTQSAAIIEKSFKAGDISEAMRSQLQVAIAGTPSEDLGTELFGKIFGAPFDQAQIDARAKQAGDTVSKAIGQYTSFEAVQRQFSAGFQVISAELVSFTDSVISPAIGFIVESFKAIYEAVAPTLGEIFTNVGDAFTNMYEIAKPIFAALAGLIGGAFLNSINSAVALLSGFASFMSTFYGRIREALQPIFQAFEQLFGGVGESAFNLQSIFEGFGDVVEVVADSFAAFGAIVAEVVVVPFQLLAGFIGNVVQFLQRFVFGSRDASAATKQLGDSTGKAVGFFEALMNGMRAIPALLEGVRASFVAFKNIIFDIYDTITNVFENNIGGTVSRLIDIFRGAGDKVAGEFKSGFNNAQIFKNLQKEVEATKLKLPDLDASAQNAAIEGFKKNLYAAVNNNQINQSQKKQLEDAVQELYALRTQASAKEQADEKAKQALMRKGAEDQKKNEEELLAKLKAKFDIEKQRNAIALQRYEAELSADGLLTEQEKLQIAQKKLELDTASKAAYEDIYNIVNDLNGVAVSTNIKVSEGAKNGILTEILGIQKDVNNQRIALNNVSFDKDALAKQLQVILDSFDNTTIETSLSAVIGIDVDNAQTIAITKEFGRLLAEATSSGVGGAIAGVVETQFDTAIQGAQNKILQLNQFIADQTNALNSITDADQKKRTEEQIAKARTEAQNLAKIVQDSRLKVEEAGFKRRLALAQDQNERELILQTQALAKELNDTINGALLTAEEKEGIMREYLRREQALIEAYRRRNERGFVSGLRNAADTAAQAIAQVFAEPFTFSIDVETQNQAKERIAELTEEQNRLFESFKKGEVSFEDYQNQLAGISAAMDEAKASMDEFNIWDAFLDRSAQAFEQVRSQLMTTFQGMLVEQGRYNAEVQTLNEELAKIHDESSQEYVDVLKKRDAATQKSSDFMTTALGTLSLTMAAQLGQLVADQKPFLQALVVSLLDTLQAMVPVFVAMITGFSLSSAESVASAGILGVAKAAGITALLTAAVAAARAAVASSFGFKEGGYTGDGGRDEVGGVVHKGEVVFEQPIVSKQKGEIMQLRALLQTGVKAKDLLEAYHGGGNFMSGWSVGEDGQLVPSVSVQVSQKMAAVQSQLVRTQAQTKMAINTMFALQRQSNDSLLSEIKSLKRAVIQSANQYEAHTYSHVELGLDSKLLSKEQHNDIKIRRAR